MADLQRIAEFLFEAGQLARTPRSGFALLGSGAQSVADHSHRTMLVAYALATLDGAADADRVVKLCLFHDLPETRTSDLNQLTKQYNEPAEQRALTDQSAGLPFGEQVRAAVEEFEAGRTHEAGLARDADQVELILSLKEQLDRGNQRAQRWIDRALPRLATDAGRQLAERILQTDSDRWWMAASGQAE